MDAYLEAAEAMRKYLSGRCSLKTAIYDTPPRNLRRVFALCMEASKRRAALEAAIAESGLGAAARAAQADGALLLVLTHELLFGAKKIAGGGAVRRLVLDHEAALREAAGVAAPAPGAPNAPAPGTAPAPGAAAASSLAFSSAAAADAPSPALAPAPAAGGAPKRFVRVNLLRTSVPAAVVALCDAAQSPTGAALSRAEIAASAHVPYVLALPHDAHARLELHRHPLVLSGALILQDLASALPAHALLEGAARPPRGAAFDVIDACAAPGNKTSQLAALLAALARPDPGAFAFASSASSSAHSSSADAGATPTPASGSRGGAKKRKRQERERERQQALLMGDGEGGEGEGEEVGEGDGGAAGRPAPARAPSRAPAPAPAPTPASAAPATGTVFAFDRSEQRLELLRRRVAEAGAAPRVVVARADFLALAPADPLLRNVRMLLLDPSCSGSGMPAHAAGGGAEGGAAGGAAGSGRGVRTGPAPPVPSAAEAGRVRSLADFQTRALVHALSFPQVRRVAYSTCSLFAAEDEVVVAAALAQHNAGAAAPQHARLVAALPAWPRRGFAGQGLSAAEAACVVRAFPEDGTHGFFVAVLEKGVAVLS